MRPHGEAVVLSAVLLAVAGELTRRIDAGVVARGLEGVGAAHGFVFARLAPDGATVTELAAPLGVTGQAADRLVDEAVRQGCAERRVRPGGARARLVVLTERGWACARAAEEAAAEVVRGWSGALGRVKCACCGTVCRVSRPMVPSGPAGDIPSGGCHATGYSEVLPTRNFTLALLVRNLMSETASS